VYRRDEIKFNTAPGPSWSAVNGTIALIAVTLEPCSPSPPLNVSRENFSPRKFSSIYVAAAAAVGSHSSVNKGGNNPIFVQQL